MKINLYSCLAVFLGGGLGCLLRYFVTCFAAKYHNFLFPYHTFMVNIVSCFIIGFAFSVLVMKFDAVQSAKVFVMAGFCGGLSTFSAFSLEIITMFQQEQYFMAFLYAVLSFIFCILATSAGMFAGGLLKNV